MFRSAYLAFLAVGVVAGLVFGQAGVSPEISARVHRSVTERFRQAGPDDSIKVWVLFQRDKGLETARSRAEAIERVHESYPARAVDRRKLRRTRPGLFDIDDVPVPQGYVEGVRSSGADVRVVSRWVNGVSAWMTAEQVRQVAALPFVEKIQPVRRGRAIDPVAMAGRGMSGSGNQPTPAGPAGFYGQAEAQLTQMNLIALHDLGFTGAGVVVGILDTGFKRTHAAFNEPGHSVNIIAEYDFVDDDENTSFEVGDPSSQHSHGTLILGTLGAYWPNSLVGGAYDASFILAKTEDTTDEYPAEEDNYVAGLEFIELNGGDMATSSLGYIDWYTQADLDGLTAVTTVAVNLATADGLHFCTAAGNEGHDANPATSSLIAPADAMQIITVGAVSSTGAIVGFSSDGPTADGRVKPELLARGLDTRTVDPFDDGSITGSSGTSLSTPLVASVVACLIQAHPEWTVDQMRQQLFETADYFVANGTFEPTFVRGFGIANAAAAAGIGEDCNDNGVDDLQDILDETSQDCNGNGVPDECEPNEDCNNNTIQDICDIAAETSDDCNGDGVPDECPGCADDCECWETVTDPCTHGVCQAGTCAVVPNLYGDVDRNTVINVFDLFCVLDGFQSVFDACRFEDDDVHPCGGNGFINIFDLFAVLDAFEGADPCCQ